jgi:hypothetical protein
VATATGPAAQGERAWQRLSAATRSAEPPSLRGRAPAESTPRHRRARLAWALAATLALTALALAVVGGGELQRSRRRAAVAERSLEQTRADRDRLAGQVAAIEQRIGASEEALERLREELDDAREQLAASSSTGPADPWPARLAVAVQPLFRQRGETVELLVPGTVPGAAPVELRAPAAGEPLRLQADLTALAAFPQVILQLTDHRGRILWWQRLPGDRLSGDLGTEVEIRGLPAGEYRLTAEGWSTEDSATRTLRFTLLG